MSERVFTLVLDEGRYQLVGTCSANGRTYGHLVTHSSSKKSR